MRTLAIVTGLVTGFVLMSGSASIGGKESAGQEAVGAKTVQKVQTICPVMGGKVNKKFFADYEGKRVYFCCGGCPAEFAKDPSMYVKGLEGEGMVLEKAPEKPEGKEAAKPATGTEAPKKSSCCE